MNKVLIGIVALIVVIGAVILLTNNKSQKQTVIPSPTAQSQMQASPSAKMAEATVTLTRSGFNPQTLTIKAGTKVTWVNHSGETATVNSDPHPTHTLWPFLNLGSFDDGGSVSVVFDKTGTYTYHNHLNPSETGTVIVE